MDGYEGDNVDGVDADEEEEALQADDGTMENFKD